MRDRRGAGLSDRAVAGLVFLGVAALYGSLTRDVLIHGDTLQYAECIRYHGARFLAQSVGYAAIHLGYYLLGLAFTSLAPVSISYGLNALNVLLAAGTAVQLYLLARTLGCGRSLALTPVFFLGANRLFASNAIFAEVYVPLTFFGFLSLLLWIREHPAAGGLAFGAAFLISPAAAFLLPAFLILRRPRWHAMFCFGGLSTAVIAPVVLFHWVDFWQAVGQASSSPLDVLGGIQKEIIELLVSFPFALPLITAGFPQLLCHSRWRPLGLALACVWSVSFFLGETRWDVPVQLPAHVLLALVGALGWHSLIREPSGRLAWAGAGSALLFPTYLYARSVAPASIFATVVTSLVFFGILGLLLRRIDRTGFPGRVLSAFSLVVPLGLGTLVTVGSVNRTQREFVQLRTSFHEIDQAATEDYRIVAPYNEGQVFEYYVLGSLWTGRWIYDGELLEGEGFASAAHERAARQLAEARESGREIWIVATRHPGIHARLESAGYRIEPYGDRIERARPGDPPPE